MDAGCLLILSAFWQNTPGFVVRMMDERADFTIKASKCPGEAKRDREKAQEDAKDLLMTARKQIIRGIAADERLKRR